jgi:catechol 2,3-dioxygenase-like lactoylglutathione lyase family enzyme
MIRTLSHVCFFVSDLGKSTAFYCQKLGLRKAFDLNILGGKVRGVYLHAGGRTFIELFEGQRQPTPPEASYRHCCFEVDDIKKAVLALRGQGAEVTDIKRGTDGSYQAWLADPDGNRIELHQFTDQSRQTAALEELEA